MKLPRKPGAERSATVLIAAALAISLLGTQTVLAPPADSYLWTANSHTGAVYGTAFSADGTLFVTGSDDMTVKIWDALTGELIRTLTGATNVVRAVAISPDGTLVAAGSADKKVRIWRVSDGTLLFTMQGHTGGICSVAFSPDGTRLVSGSDDKNAKIQNVTTGTLVRTLTGHGNYVRAVAWSSNDRIATGSWDCGIKIWNATTGALVKSLTEHTGYVNSLDFSSDSLKLVSASQDRTIKIWDVTSGTASLSTALMANPVLSVDYSPDNSYIVNVDSTGFISFIFSNNGQMGATQYTETAQVPSVKWSPDGRYLGYGRVDNLVVMARSALVSPSCSYITTYGLWKSCKFTPAERADPNISGPDADPDGDGVSNMIEYAMGTDPKVASPEARITGLVTNGYARISFRNNVLAADLIFEVGATSSLQNPLWDYSSATLDSTTPINDSVNLITVRDLNPITAYPGRFYRLRITYTGSRQRSAGGYGTVFRLSPGGVATTILSFDGTNGANPRAGLAPAADGKLCGTTVNGGPYGGGTVYAVALDPRILVQPAGLTTLAGATVTLTVGAQGTGPLGCQWQWNGTNLLDGEGISGALSPTLTLSNVVTNFPQRFYRAVWTP